MKKIIIITSFLLVLNCNSEPQGQENSFEFKSSSDGVKISINEFKSRKKQFNILRGVMIEKLRRKNNFTILRDYLAEDFYYLNQFIKSEGDPNVTVTIHFNNNDRNLIEISEKIDIKALLHTLEKGKISFSKKSAFLYSPHQLKNPEKYPLIDCWYYSREKKWKLYSIRFEPNVD